ncbi:MAG: acetate--CoA ligase family protein, partial [Ignavibacteriaceae bacterium]|nr:acetate--CoA ligase family protein [Ignavibacteriaceae bacterium]
YGYTGKIFPVNPKADEVLGYKCYKSIDEIDAPVYLALVMVPKNFAEDTIDQLLGKNIKSIILITAGFKEIGKAGEEVENRILRKVKENGARLVGPNCMGVITTFDEIKLNATFVAEKPEVGSTAFLSQSGAIGAAVLNSLRETDIRFGHFISVGNKADINENDLLEFWEDDEKIKTLTFYLESFIDGEKFIKPFIQNKIKKPVIVLKAGRTTGGIKAASSHTGALASNDKIVDAVLKQFGILRADTLNELFNTAKGFENFPLPKGNKVAVITNAGGPAILAVDALERTGFKLAALDEKTKIKLREIIHPEGSACNPVDLLPGGSAEQFKIVNEIIAADENVDAVVSIFVEPVMVPAFNVIEGINAIQSTKPVLQVVMPLPELWEEYRHNSKYKLPLFRTPEDPAAVLWNMLKFNRGKNNSERLNASVNKLVLTGEGFIEEEKVNELCRYYGLPVVQSNIYNEDELQKTDIIYPIVVKGISKAVVHKTEFDAVRLNIKNKIELLTAVEEIKTSFNNRNVNAEGFLIQPFIKIKHEVLIGGFRDPSFGPIIMFGTGGKYVEVYDDTAMRSAYLNDDDIEEMINETKMGKILHGVRGEAPVDLDGIKRVINSSAQMMLDNPGITEFDFNPLLV